MVSYGTYDRLLSDSESGRIVFRIWCEAGDSPLITHPSRSRSGFFSQNSFSKQLDQAAYKRLNSGVNLESGGTWVRKSILDHVKGPGDWLLGDRNFVEQPPHLASRPVPLRCSRSGSGSKQGSSWINNRERMRREEEARKEEEESITSPWIVTHQNLNWVIHRITRFLSRDYGARFHMTVIELDEGEQKIELYTESAKHLLKLKYETQWGKGERKLLNESYNFADRSKEVLFYGRILGERIREDYIWSNDRLPFNLPNWFWRDQPPILVRSWMDSLIWIPRVTSYTLANKWMNEKKEKESIKSTTNSVIGWCERINR